MQRVLVVPWSMEATKSANGMLLSYGGSIRTGAMVNDGNDGKCSDTGRRHRGDGAGRARRIVAGPPPGDGLRRIPRPRRRGRTDKAQRGPFTRVDRRCVQEPRT